MSFEDNFNCGRNPVPRAPISLEQAFDQPMKKGKTTENVNHPKHYNVGKIEVIDAIEDWKLGFNDGNAVKYIARHQHKRNAIQDIEKAIWYLNRHLENLRKQKPEESE